MTQVPPGRSLLAGQWSWPVWFVATVVITGVAALVSIWLGRHHSVRAKIVWTVVVLVIPVVGPVAWFVLGRERRRP